MSLKVIAAVDDLIFAAKIKGTAAGTGAEARFAKSLAAVLTQARADKPDLILVDLHAKQCEPFALAVALKSDETCRDITLIGFFSHVQTELMRQAQAAGYDQVMPRSAFTKRLPELLRGKDAGTEMGREGARE